MLHRQFAGRRREPSRRHPESVPRDADDGPGRPGGADVDRRISDHHGGCRRDSCLRGDAEQPGGIGLASCGLSPPITFEKNCASLAVQNLAVGRPVCGQDRRARRSARRVERLDDPVIGCVCTVSRSS